MDNILAIHEDLAQQRYKHGGYYAFKISDPKPRQIHKASVRDRLVHHAIYRILYPRFDKLFIADSYSCRLGKGTHKALRRFKYFSNIASKNNTRTVWVLKCDIKKFFANIDHEILFSLLEKRIQDKNIIDLLKNIVSSFSVKPSVGLPLGNLTSQLLVNIYMNEFDQFAKHTLKARHYLRYADDFVFLSDDRSWIESLIPRIQEFLTMRLRLTLHPDKLFIKTVASGVDFLGWVHFPDHRVLRTATKRRMFRGLRKTKGKNATIQSYLGLMSHGNTKKLQSEIEKLQMES
ncbi:MAG: reverse transcriptase/maturase family protein [Patescibacteria group bacterium]